MLQAPIRDRKTKAEASSKTAEHLPEYEQSSQSIGGMGRSRQSQPLQQQENFAALQKTYGNQAVLRMKGRSPAANPVQGVLQLTSAITGTPVSHEGGDAEASLVKIDETLDVKPDRDKLPGSPNACVVQAAVGLPYSRSGILRYSTGTVGEQFEVRAEWSNASPASRGESSYCAAECGEYHQFIKGHMKSSAEKDGSNLTDVSGQVFGGQKLDENIFREDGLDSNPKARYGHRKEARTMNEEYKPDRLTGKEYIGKDFPSVLIGTFADIDVTFLGKLMDTCNGKENFSDTWQVKYRGVIRP
jgi:hypothetical protein